MIRRIGLLLLFTLVADAQEAPRPQGVNFYSEAQEAALGEQLAKQIRAQTTPLPSSLVQDYVKQLGARLTARLPENVWNYNFEVVADDRGPGANEPVALPGGYIFISARMILTAHNEAELAGMLAHAIAHVAARHGTRLATRAEIAQQASIPLVYLSGWPQANGSKVPASVVRMQAKLELEADRVGAGLMAQAGYDPAALLAYVERLQNSSSEDRVENLKQAIRALPEARYSAPDGLSPIQEEVRRLVPPPPAPSLR